MPKIDRTRLICCFALAFITMAVYWPVRHFDFTNYDDTDYVVYNGAIHKGVTAAGVEWALKSGYASNWHPLTWISHMADCGLYGLKPGGHHLTNLLFHTANSVLLFLVMVELTGATWRSALVAALFAWHPLHVESVAWVSERKDVLSAFFWFLTMLAYVRYVNEFKAQFNAECGVRSAESRRGQRLKIFYGLALLAFALGLMAKPMVVTLPFVLLLLDFWPLGRIYDLRFTIYESKTEQAASAGCISPARLILEKAPFFVLAALDCVATFIVQRNGDAVVKAAALPFPARLANALVSYARYLGKTVWPANLAAPYPFSDNWTFWTVAGAALFLVVVSAVVLWRIRDRPYLAVGWFWFLGTLVPVIGLVQVGIQSMADRYTYIPLIGIFIMLAWSIPGGWTKWPSPGLVFGAITGGVLMALLTCTEVQLQYWRNSVTLFSHTVEVTSNSILAEYNLAEALARQGDEEQAIVHYQKALAIHPNPVEAQYNSQTQAHFNLGLIFRSQKKWADAEMEFRAFLRDEPNEPRAHVALAGILQALGRNDEAARESQIVASLQSGISGIRHDAGAESVGKK